MPAALAMGLATTAFSQVQTLPYVPDQAVPLVVSPGFALMVELAPDERVESVIVGNSRAWQVTPTKRGDQIVVKSVGEAPATDMIVTTDSRRYVFSLSAGNADQSAYVIRFDYPEKEAAKVVATPIKRFYKLKGDKILFPVEMSDDGQQTSFRWMPNIALPAIFTLDRSGDEALVNGRMVGETYVVEGVSPRYALRRGRALAVAVRQRQKAKQ